MRTGLLVGVLLMAVGVAACTGPPDDGVSDAPLRHPFRGATLIADGDSTAAHWQRAHNAGWLDPIVTTPQARWVTGPEELLGLAGMLRVAGQQGALPVVVAYHIPDRDCAGQGAASAPAYESFIGRLVDTLAATRSVVILEPDAVVADCFDESRAAMLTAATRRLAGAGHFVYLDAGHPRWRPPGLDRVAALLWVKRPGESDGACGGETAGTLFAPRQARTLIVNAPSVPAALRDQAAAAQFHAER